MQCMKCGRDTVEGQVFCDICQAEMEKYPVRPGTAVLLPQYHRGQTTNKKPVKRTIPPEEQIRKLKKRNRLMLYLLALAVAVAMGMGWLAMDLYEEYGNKYLPGQNYSAKETVPAESSGEVSAETTIPFD